MRNKVATVQPFGVWQRVAMHALPKVSPDPSTPCGRATPETTGSLRLTSTLLDTPRRTPMLSCAWDAGSRTHIRTPISGRSAEKERGTQTSRELTQEGVRLCNAKDTAALLQSQQKEGPTV
jgi:hypothetical protein